jgi:ElaB/YqjD/DUF883 family membrane-anchored ribosome-binding protein
MANPISNTAQSNLRDASNEVRETSESLLNEATPRAREALEQISATASDLYGRANRFVGEWTEKGNNRTYGMIALVAGAGLLGFALGRNLGSRSSMPSSGEI